MTEKKSFSFITENNLQTESILYVFERGRTGKTPGDARDILIRNTLR